jgi:pyrroline-5-carboxylate reductase
MRIGLIGAGNMARALARGWGEPVLCTDAGSGRAASLAGELGGEALGSNAELAERADLLVLCHKPAQLVAIAAEAGGSARTVASVLAGVSVADLQDAYPRAAVFRLMPNTPVEVRRGVLCYARAEGVDAGAEEAVLERFGRLGRVVEVPERLMDAATGVSGVLPAYAALMLEAHVDAAVRHGIPAEQACAMAVEALAGSAALMAVRGNDLVGVRREVTSPGGVTARGLAALERGGVRAAFGQAMDAVAGEVRA